MRAKYEKRIYSGIGKVWVGKYRNLHNLSHWHFESELIVCLDGSAEIIVESELFLLHKNDCILIKGEMVHHINASPSSILQVAIFNNSLAKDAVDFFGLKSPVFKDRYKISETLNIISEETKEKGPFYGQIVNGIFSSLIFSIFRSEEIIPIDVIRISPSILRYRQLLQTIEKNFDTITFEEAAKQMNMSQSYFSRYFTSIAGMSFTKYLNIIKTENAIDFILKDNEITSRELIAKCGFSTVRNFNKVFKEITGYPPKSLPKSFPTFIRTSLDIDGSRFNPTLMMSELL